MFFQISNIILSQVLNRAPQARSMEKSLWGRKVAGQVSGLGKREEARAWRPHLLAILASLGHLSQFPKECFLPAALYSVRFLYAGYRWGRRPAFIDHPGNCLSALFPMRWEIEAFIYITAQGAPFLVPPPFSPHFYFRNVHLLLITESLVSDYKCRSPLVYLMFCHSWCF